MGGITAPSARFANLKQAARALHESQAGLQKHQAGALTCAVRAGYALHYAQCQFDSSQIQKGEYKAWVEEHFGSPDTARKYTRLARLARSDLTALGAADGLEDALAKLAGTPVPGELNEWCETPEQAADREAEEAHEVEAKAARAAKRKPKKQLNAYRHPESEAGKAAEKAEKILLQAVDRAGTPEGGTFLVKAGEIVKEHHLVIEVGVNPND